MVRKRKGHVHQMLLRAGCKQQVQYTAPRPSKPSDTLSRVRPMSHLTNHESQLRPRPCSGCLGSQNLVLQKAPVQHFRSKSCATEKARARFAPNPHSMIRATQIPTHPVVHQFESGRNLSPAPQLMAEVTVLTARITPNVQARPALDISDRGIFLPS